MEAAETEIDVLVDGFGGMAIVDSSNTHPRIISYLGYYSVWELIDGVEKEPKGKYKVSIRFWEESAFPEDGFEFITEVVSRTLINDSGG